ncbi:MAG: glycoside hydrolase family 2 [Prevotella sp.]|nr:glycoside hydrolase family 2 [Prevotella sp.]
MRRVYSLCVLFMLAIAAIAQDKVSVAGLFPVEDQGRQIWNFNPGWRFYKGDAAGAERVDFDDSAWQVVATPHCVELEPAECSGGRNYQGVAWYRKSFTMPANSGELHFEAVMGKQKIWVNGQLATEHYGGYLPITVDLGKFGVKKGDKCLVAVMTDNSNDNTYPPGKPQYTLDFQYHGGIYRDVWLISKNDVFITDPIVENKQAGGGVFVHYENISEKSADVLIDIDVRNIAASKKRVVVDNILLDKEGRQVGHSTEKLVVEAGSSTVSRQRIRLTNPRLWSPETPYLYSIVTRVKEGKTTLDAGETRIGIRSFEFRGKDGFWLNGHKYRQFVGANRHQDFAYVGNAMPNGQQWRDVLRLKNAGFNIIRTAHYPQDPSFMDACDELGIFIIVATPGWQYWNKKETIFEDRVLQNTREIIRRDRNHPSVLMWEPILNETRFPLDFSLKSLQITKDEYPYPYRPVAAADEHSAGVRENYDVVYGWPGDDEKADKPSQCIFTREFGEYVDDWYAHNNLNRASRSWGERPQLTQALSLSSTTEQMHRTTGQFIGGAQWHPFDHQRGYHPDPYWGGDYDAFRQTKYAFYMFASQRDADAIKVAEADQAGPMVYIAHEMTQFSDSDVVVFSNCDSVKLTMYDGAKSWTLPVRHSADGEYNAPVVFKGAWNFWEARDYSYTKKSWQTVNILAEGIRDGKVVCQMRRMPSRRSTKLRLYLDDMSKPLVADGSDFVVVVAEVTDDNGNVRRLAKEDIVFTVDGEGTIIGDRDNGANPRAVEWGSAPLLVRSTMRAGKIHIHAEVLHPGTHAPTPADIEIESVPYQGSFCYDNTLNLSKSVGNTSQGGNTSNPQQLSEDQRKKLLQEVEQQQADFGIGN